MAQQPANQGINPFWSNMAKNVWAEGVGMLKRVPDSLATMGISGTIDELAYWGKLGDFANQEGGLAHELIRGVGRLATTTDAEERAKILKQLEDARVFERLQVDPSEVRQLAALEGAEAMERASQLRKAYATRFAEGLGRRTAAMVGRRVLAPVLALSALTATTRMLNGRWPWENAQGEFDIPVVPFI